MIPEHQSSDISNTAASNECMHCTHSMHVCVCVRACLCNINTLNMATQPTSKATCRLHFPCLQSTRLKARADGLWSCLSSGWRRAMQTEGLIVVWSLKIPWSQAMWAYYLDMSITCPLHIKTTQTAHSTTSFVSKHTKILLFYLKVTQTRARRWLIESVVALTGSLWRVQQCPRQSLCIPFKVFSTTGVFLVRTVTHTKRKAPQFAWLLKTFPRITSPNHIKPSGIRKNFSSEQAKLSASFKMD